MPRRSRYAVRRFTTGRRDAFEVYDRDTDETVSFPGYRYQVEKKARVFNDLDRADRNSTR